MVPYLTNIFLADDDQDDVYLFTYALERIFSVGCQITTFENGQALVDNLKAAHAAPDIIFTDINMPVLDGLETVHAIRDIPLLASTPIVMYSTSANECDARKAHENGASLYVVKPYNLEDLERLLEKILTFDWDKFTAPGNLRDFIIRPSAIPSFLQHP